MPSLASTTGGAPADSSRGPHGEPPPAGAGGRNQEDAYWHEPLEVLLRRLSSAPEGLSSSDAASRLFTPGGRPLAGISRSGAAAAVDLLLRQFASPIILMLLGAALLSFGLDSLTDGLIILVIVLVSGLLGFWQEHGAERAVQQLLAVVELRCAVWRDGVEVSIPMAEVVRGDVVRLAAGDGIPGDCRLIEERDLCVDEAALTEVLAQKCIAGAALDVIHTEPLADHSAVRSLDNVILTPHRVGHTWESDQSLIVATTANVQALWRGQAPPLLCNPDALALWPQRRGHS